MFYLNDQRRLSPEQVRHDGFDEAHWEFLEREKARIQHLQRFHNPYTVKNDMCCPQIPGVDANQNAIMSENLQRSNKSPSKMLVVKWAAQIFSDFNMAEALLESRRMGGADPFQNLNSAVAQLMGKVANEYLRMVQSVLVQKFREMLSICAELGQTLPQCLVSQDVPFGKPIHESSCPHGDVQNQLYLRNAIHEKLCRNEQIQQILLGAETPHKNASPFELGKALASPFDAALQNSTLIATVSQSATPEENRVQGAPLDSVPKNVDPSDGARQDVAAFDDVAFSAAAHKDVAPSDVAFSHDSQQDVAPSNDVVPSDDVASLNDARRDVAAAGDMTFSDSARQDVSSNEQQNAIPPLEGDQNLCPARSTPVLQPNTEDHLNQLNSNSRGKQMEASSERPYRPVVSPISSDQSVAAPASSQSFFILQPSDTDKFPKSSTPKSFLTQEIMSASVKPNVHPNENASPMLIPTQLAAEMNFNRHQLTSLRSGGNIDCDGMKNPLKRFLNFSTSNDWQSLPGKFPPQTNPQFGNEFTHEKACHNHEDNPNAPQISFVPHSGLSPTTARSVAQDWLLHAKRNEIKFTDLAGQAISSSSPAHFARAQDAATCAYPAVRYGYEPQHVIEAPAMYEPSAPEYSSVMQAQCFDPWACATQPTFPQHPQVALENINRYCYTEFAPQDAFNNYLNSLRAQQWQTHPERSSQNEQECGEKLYNFHCNTKIETENPNCKKWSDSFINQRFDNGIRYSPSYSVEKKDFSSTKYSCDAHQPMWKYDSPILNSNLQSFEPPKDLQHSVASIIRSRRSSSASSQEVNSAYSLTNSSKSKSVKTRASVDSQLLSQHTKADIEKILDVRSAYSYDSLDAVFSQNYKELSLTNPCGYLSALSSSNCGDVSSLTSKSNVEETVLESSRRKIVFPVLCGEFYNQYDNKNCSMMRHAGLSLSFPGDAPPTMDGFPPRLSTSSLPYELQVNFDHSSYVEEFNESVFYSGQNISYPVSYDETSESELEIQSDHRELHEGRCITSINFEVGHDVSLESSCYSSDRTLQNSVVESSQTLISSRNSYSLSSGSPQHEGNNESSSNLETEQEKRYELYCESNEDSFLSETSGQDSVLDRANENKIVPFKSVSCENSFAYSKKCEVHSVKPKISGKCKQDHEVSLEHSTYATRVAAPKLSSDDTKSKDSFSKTIYPKNQNSVSYSRKQTFGGQGSGAVKNSSKKYSSRTIESISDISQSDLNEVSLYNRTASELISRFENRDLCSTQSDRSSASEKSSRSIGNTRETSDNFPAAKSSDAEESTMSVALPVPSAFYKLTYTAPKRTVTVNKSFGTELSELEVVSASHIVSKSTLSDSSVYVHKKNVTSMSVCPPVGKVKALIQMFENFHE